MRACCCPRSQPKKNGTGPRSWRRFATRPASRRAHGRIPPPISSVSLPWCSASAGRLRRSLRWISFGTFKHCHRRRLQAHHRRQQRRFEKAEYRDEPGAEQNRAQARARKVERIERTGTLYHRSSCLSSAEEDPAGNRKLESTQHAGNQRQCGKRNLARDQAWLAVGSTDGLEQPQTK